ncbi:MAG TPA: phosphoglucosamine mutase, partial [Candidatus Saccharimonadales bacterium]|nr:phosphoglucosamine mutase [Candidatus Saccharimonadales bacterium]
VSVGVLPTAAVAFLTRDGGFDAGVMISASHNPYEDNGIKVFSRDGYKLPDELESRIESIVLDGGGDPEPASEAAAEGPGGAEARDLVDRYRRHLVAAAGGTRLEGETIVLDCANGAASGVAPGVFRELGARVHAISAAPDGRNINEGCGSLHPEALCRAVVERGARLGFAFDGDADRCLMSDDRGDLCDGDLIMYRAALMLRDSGRLGPDLVVGTVMSNLWLERSLSAAGITLVRTPVGDKYVLEEMLRRGARVGGEQSGHVIFMDHATTGDGLLTAVMMASAAVRAGVLPSRWRAEVAPCPQVLLNVRVSARPDLESHPVIGPAVAAARERLGGDGRILLRYSGTEPLARVMVEAVDGDLTGSLAREIAGLIEKEIGEKP